MIKIKSKKSPGGKTAVSVSPQEKQQQRTVFNLQKDILLLKSDLQRNPWHTDEDAWELMLQVLKDAFADFPPTLSIRTIKGRANILIIQLQTQELIVKTGTEVEYTERGNLLDEIISIMAFTEQPINTEFGAEDGPLSPDPENESSQGLMFSEAELAAVTTDKGKRQKKVPANEKAIADKERDSLVTAMQTGLPPPPPHKRGKMTFEDELIQTKQTHEIEVEKQRLDLEREKLTNDYLLENQRLENERNKTKLEEKKLELESKKEDRLSDESKRRDELARAQIDSQNKMYELMLKFTEKKA